VKTVKSQVSDDLFRYLTFLEKTRFVNSKEEILNTALEYYRRLAMHDWLPFTYRMGGGRVMFMDTTMILDFFHVLTNREILNAARTSALKRKVTNPFFKGLDLSDSRNWSIVLREMEIMGWGKFTHLGDRVRVESCILPATYLQGYLEGMFGGRFKHRQSKTANVMEFIHKEKSHAK
jgi:hypothetical protein